MSIESSIDTELKTGMSLEQTQRYTAFSSINVRRDGSIDDPPEKLEETRAWMLDMLPKLKEVFETRVEKILQDQSSQGRGLITASAPTPR